MRLDALSATALMINFAELVVLVSYYLPLVRSVPFALILNNEIDLHRISNHFVSDLLHSNSVYCALMTGLVAMHLGVCAAFVIRLNWTRPSERPLLIVELIFLITAWFGWAILNHVYHDSDGRIVVWHIVGAGMFIFSSSLYFGCMAWNVAVLGRGAWSGLESMLMALIIFLFIVSAASGSVFVVSVFDKRVPLPWIFEHASFIMFVGANILLFIVESLVADSIPVSSNPFRGVRIQSE